ncbi:protein unc-119 homolog B isoform X2 [Macaca fascicularis]|uniref:protein unc-119 homolog B isoform X2 n=1 Tax=Macaca fascicularis TaxID=9541 RepID=UPI003D15C1FD
MGPWTLSLEPPAIREVSAQPGAPALWQARSLTCFLRRPHCSPPPLQPGGPPSRFGSRGLPLSVQIIYVNPKTTSTVLILPASKFEIWRQGQYFLRLPNLAFQTRRRMRRREVETWTSAQDVLSAISSHRHFSASGQSGLLRLMIENPYETRSDSFYFVDNKLIMHNKADYAYNGGQ